MKTNSTLRRGALFAAAALLVFGSSAFSYTLDELVQAALTNSPQSGAARLETAAKQTGIREARSRFLPTLTGQLSGSLLSNPPEGMTLPAGSFGTAPVPIPNEDVVLAPDPENTYFQVKFGITQTIFAWGKLRNAMAVAEEALEISLLEANQTRRDLARDVRKAFAGVIFAQQALTILEEAESIYRNVSQDRERSYELGAINREELLDARSRLVEVETQSAEARLSIRTALESLRLLTGMPNLTPESLEGIIPEPSARTEDLDVLIEQARSQSQELEILRRQMRQAELNVAIQNASSGPMPDLALSVDLELSGQRFPGVPNWFDTWDAGVTVSIGARSTIFDGGARSARTDAARIQKDQAELGYESLYASLGLEISRAFESSASAHRRFLNASAKLDYVEEQEKNARVSFENELITREQLLGAQILLLTTRLEKLATAFEGEMAEADLEHFFAEPLE